MPTTIRLVLACIVVGMLSGCGGSHAASTTIHRPSTTGARALPRGSVHPFSQTATANGARITVGQPAVLATSDGTTLVFTVGIDNRSAAAIAVDKIRFAMEGRRGTRHVVGMPRPPASIASGSGAAFKIAFDMDGPLDGAMVSVSMPGATESILFTGTATASHTPATTTTHQR